MKKIALSLVLAAMSVSTAFCDSSDNNEEVSSEACAANAYDALYIGAGAGGSFLKCEGYGNKIKANRVMGLVLLGGGKVVNGVYLGAEGEYDFAQKKEKEGVKFQRALPKVSGVLGVVRGDWLAYGKAGVAFNEFEYQANGFSKNKAGFVAGLGVRKAVNNFALGAACDYNFGSKYEDLRFNKGFSVNVHVMYQIQY